jgi:two-component system phosphate regulon response regulator PhoB
MSFNHTKILLLEDDVDLTEIIKLIFEPEGFQVISSSVQYYLEDIKQYQPDIIIADHLLSHSTTGSDICIALKANPATADIPFIITSAVYNLQDIAEACCADSFIEKPFDIGYILEVVNDLLAGSRNKS